jgi:hypothetical protein
MVYVNSDHPRDVRRQSLGHELGHIFFGRGHPQNPRDPLFGGVLDYKSQRVNNDDREHFLHLYGRSRD